MYTSVNESHSVISLWQLAIAFVPAIVGLWICVVWSRNAKRASYSVLRMLVQLLLIGYLLTFLFETDSPLLVITILLLMIGASAFTMLRGATIGTILGTILGALPGIGSTAAAFMSYTMTKAVSKNPGSFGKGNIQGIAASDSANSAVVGANLIPLLTLGIPGSVGAALLISAFMIHGMQPGPLLFENQGRFVYGLFGAMIMANFVNLWVGQVLLRVWVKVVSAPESIIYSSALLLCFVGVSMATSGLFGVAVMLIFAVVGYLMSSFGYSLVIFIIAFFLGPRFEKSIAQSLALTNGDITQIFKSPVAVALLVLSVVSFIWFLRKNAQAGDD